MHCIFKKFLVFILSLITFLTTITVCFAENTPTIEVGSVTANSNASFELPVNIVNNPGISSFVFSFEYDESIFSLDHVTFNEEFGGNFYMGEKAVWVSSGNISNDGLLFTLSFSSIDSVSTTTQVSLKYDSGDICNYEEHDVDFTIVPGIVTINGNTLNSDTSSDESGESTVVSSVEEQTSETEIIKLSREFENIITSFGKDEVKRIIDNALKNQGVSSIVELSSGNVFDFVGEVIDEFDIREDEFVNENERKAMLEDIINLYYMANPEAKIEDSEILETKVADSNNSLDTTTSIKDDGLNFTIILIVAIAIIVCVAIVIVVVIKNKKVKGKSL